MSILSDKEIKRLCTFNELEQYDRGKDWKPMISPYVDGQVREVNGEKVISYGTSSYGYDIRIANEFKIFTNVNNTLLDPKNFDQRSFVDHVGDYCVIPPNSFVLARSLERFVMPSDVTGIVLGKSTYARIGVSCLATPLEAGWEGELVLEYANTTTLPMKLYANEGAAQILFFRGEVTCAVSYATRGGKYQGQTGITLPKV